MRNGVEIVVTELPVPAPDVSGYQVIALVVSLVLAFLNLGWTAYLSRQSRRRSVDDDFWFRRLVAPLVIEKSIQFATKWSNELPKQASARRGRKEKTLETVAECKAEFSEILTNCLCLKMYGPEVYKDVTARLDEIVDSVTVCMHAVSAGTMDAGAAEKACKSHAEQIGISLVAFLSRLKALQRTF